MGRFYRAATVGQRVGRRGRLRSLTVAAPMSGLLETVSEPEDTRAGRPCHRVLKQSLIIKRLRDAPLQLPKVTREARERARRLYAALRRRYPDARCALDYSNPHELLIATILSAQSTDSGVNKATPALFQAYPTAADYAATTPEEVEPFIRTIGLFRNKSRAIVESMRAIVQDFRGEVPRTMDELLTLRGVARKTANVVLGNGFGLNEGVVVDTHVERLAKRFGLAPESANVAEVERRLMALFLREDWAMLAHLLIAHGRTVCKARGGACADDPICREFCSNAGFKRRIAR